MAKRVKSLTLSRIFALAWFYSDSTRLPAINIDEFKISNVGIDCHACRCLEAGCR